MTDSEKFMKGAYEALVKRGKISEADLKPSVVTDEMLDAFENEMNIVIPEIFRAYLKAYSHNIDMIETPIPIEKIYENLPEIMVQINEMSREEIARNFNYDEMSIDEWWCGLINVPEGDPLSDLRAAIEGFREYAAFTPNDNITEEKFNRFLPIADWKTAGALCIDTGKLPENVDYNEPSTWLLRWFDHEEFDFEAAGYIDENGEIIGDILLPDFETFIKLYFYGAYDLAFNVQENLS